MEDSFITMMIGAVGLMVISAVLGVLLIISAMSSEMARSAGKEIDHIVLEQVNADIVSVNSYEDPLPVPEIFTLLDKYSTTISYCRTVDGLTFTPDNRIANPKDPVTGLVDASPLPDYDNLYINKIGWPLADSLDQHFGRKIRCYIDLTDEAEYVAYLY